MAGQEIEEDDLDAASKDIMATIDEDGDGDVTKVYQFYFHSIVLMLSQNFIFRMNL